MATTDINTTGMSVLDPKAKPRKRISYKRPALTLKNAESQETTAAPAITAPDRKRSRPSLPSTEILSVAKNPQRALREINQGNVTISDACYFDAVEPTSEVCPIYSFHSNEEGFENRVTARILDELGAGYDKNDSFVDSQETDAIIPDGWTTQCGGFYIARGQLHIRPILEKEHNTGIFDTKAFSAKDCLVSVRDSGKKNKAKKPVTQEANQNPTIPKEPVNPSKSTPDVTTDETPSAKANSPEIPLPPPRSPRLTVAQPEPGKSEVKLKATKIIYSMNSEKPRKKARYSLNLSSDSALRIPSERAKSEEV